MINTGYRCRNIDNAIDAIGFIRKTKTNILYYIYYIYELFFMMFLSMFFRDCFVIAFELLYENIFFIKYQI